MSNHKLFITAELGSNWNGDYHILEQMAKRCKSSGVNAVKMQTLSDALIERHRELPWYRNASVTENNIDIIDKIMKEVGIEWYASITYPEAVKWIDPFVKRYKIRVADSNRQDIIDACLKTGKPILISKSRPDHLINNDKITYLYGIPKYPTEWGEINFDMLLLPEFKGYSNHCLNPLALLKATRLGVEFLEFHLTHNRDDFALDNKVSFSYSEMEEIMKWLRVS